MYAGKNKNESGKECREGGRLGKSKGKWIYLGKIREKSGNEYMEEQK